MTRKPKKRAILVACENTGYLKFLDDILPQRMKAAAKRIIDFTAEAFEEINARRIFGGKYDKMVCLIDADCTGIKIRDKIKDLGKDHTLDLAILGHGGADGNDAELTLHNDEKLDEATVRGWKQRSGWQNLKLRLVYMKNFQGSKFSDAWRDLGFKTSIGTAGNDYMPEPMFTLFWTLWLDGATANAAAQKSWEQSAAIWQVVYLPAVRVERIDTPPFVRVVSTVHSYIRDAKHKVAGSKSIKFADDL